MIPAPGWREIYDPEAAAGWEALHRILRDGLGRLVRHQEPRGS